MSDTIRNTPKPPPQVQAIRRAKSFNPSGTFMEFPIEGLETSVPERFEKIVQTIVRQFSDRTENRGEKSGIAKRAFKLLPEQRATSGTTT